MSPRYTLPLFSSSWCCCGCRTLTFSRNCLDKPCTNVVIFMHSAWPAHSIYRLTAAVTAVLQFESSAALNTYGFTSSYFHQTSSSKLSMSYRKRILGAGAAPTAARAWCSRAPGRAAPQWLGPPRSQSPSSAAPAAAPRPRPSCRSGRARRCRRLVPPAPARSPRVHGAQRSAPA